MQPNHTLYRLCTAADLLLDDYFLHSVKNPTAETIAYWETIAQENPAMKTVLSEAGQLAAQLDFIQAQAPAGRQEAIWKNIETAAANPVVNIKRTKAGWWKYAAAVLVIVLGGMFWRMVNSKADQTTLRTAYGETRELALPDNSAVVLNANSVVSFRKKWHKGQPREVWVKGEALFKVTHLAKGPQAATDYERFIVHLDQLDVEVLGTTFNVRLRDNEELIALKEGSVKITRKDNGEVIYMKPGDVISINKAMSPSIQRTVTDTANVDGWMRHRLHFDNTSLESIVQLLKDNYGLEIEVRDTELLKKTISGDVDAANADVLLGALKIMMGIQVTREGNRIIME